MEEYKRIKYFKLYLALGVKWFKLFKCVQGKRRKLIGIKLFLTLEMKSDVVKDRSIWYWSNVRKSNVTLQINKNLKRWKEGIKNTAQMKFPTEEMWYLF